MKPVVIIGTGLAGYSVAREFRKHDKATPLVMLSRDDGANYYKPDISEALTKQNTADDLVKKTAAEMAEQLDADIRPFTPVKSFDAQAHTIQLDGETLEYSKLVLANGAHPHKPEVIGSGAERIYQVNDRQDYAKFRQALGSFKRVVILGAGLIGCEFSNDLASHGIQVNCIDPIAWPLKRHVPEACGKALQMRLAQIGVKWHLGRTVMRVDQDAETGARVELDDGTGINADIVLAAVGLKPNIKLAREAGLKVNDGVVVDRSLRTSTANVYALGDCAEVAGLFRPYVAPLMQAGRALGKVLAGKAAQVKYPALPIVVKTPACPVIIYPAVNDLGKWKIDGEGANITARYMDDGDDLAGFVLTGDATKQRGQFIKTSRPLLG